MATKRNSSTSSAKRQLVFSKYHPSRPCGTCALCGKSEGYYSHFGGWGEGEKAFVVKHLGHELPFDACICRGDHKEAKRHHTDTEYFPKWVSQQAITTSKNCCFFPDCHITGANEKLISPSFDSIANIEALLCRQSTPSQPLIFCSKHYREVHRQLASPPSCKSCGTKPNPGTCLVRHSPDALRVSNHLQSTVGPDFLAIQPSDKICTMCYKAHTSILKSLDEQSNTPDQILRDHIEIWQLVLVDENTDGLSKAIVSIVLFVANELLHQRALLLPAVCRMFLAECGASDSASDLHLKSGEGVVNFSGRWLLQQLITYLGPHMCYRCVNRKFGTVLYRKGGDLLHALSWALSSQSKPCEVVLNHSDCHKGQSEERSIREAADIINSLLHEHIKLITSHEGDPKYDPSQFKINKLIEEVNPLLWGFLELSTRSVRERLNPQLAPQSAALHTKMVRRFYILCLLLSCTNLTQTTPMHLVLTDAVEVCGGSRKLMKILNRVGAICSADTHDRFVTSIAEHQREKRVWDDLSSDIFTVVSADNFDLLQSHAGVYCGINIVAIMEQPFRLFNLIQLYTCTLPLGHSQIHVIYLPRMCIL